MNLDTEVIYSLNYFKIEDNILQMYDFTKYMICIIPLASIVFYIYC